MEHGHDRARHVIEQDASPLTESMTQTLVIAEETIFGITEHSILHRAEGPDPGE
jgi:hypothetical protein